MSIAASLLLLSAAAAPATVSPVGVWRNADDSVRIRVAACEGAATPSMPPALCGTVVAASEKARADAAAGGTPQLVGARLLTGFRPKEPRVWAGQAFVPDIGVTLRGTMTLATAESLDVAGCLVGGFGCRSQRWTRIAPAAAPPPRPRR